MSKQWKPSKPTVELHKPAGRPSRIRREPKPIVHDQHLSSRNAWWDSREWEIRLAIIGISFFALAISALVFDIGEFLIG